MQGQLKFITCGSVDDGKSTLIGHMLYDAKLIFADQAQALELESKTASAGGKVDYSLLLDGLAAEREQGITIDVAYRYFNTEERSFIVADCPGHEEYTRNMAVGASFADLAVILVDASKGLLTQTRRHTRICALMGIRHFVFAVNKMDLVDFDRHIYNSIARDIRIMIAEYTYDSLEIIPVSATLGDNVIGHSSEMPWYEGTPLLHYLERIDVNTSTGEGGFTLPVQRVCRPDHNFRGFEGSVATGTLSVGDPVRVLPNNTSSTVARLLNAGEDVTNIWADEAVTVVLADEIDVSRGCVIESGSRAQISSFFTVEMLWMDDTDLLPGKNYLFRIGTYTVPGTVLNIKYKIDVNTGEKLQTKRIAKNEIALCDVSLSEKVVFEKFSDNRDLGSLIIIDRLTNATSGCGTISHKLNRSDNLTWHDMDINRNARERHMGQHAFTLWFTGLSGSGKSTLANEVEKRLYMKGRFTMLLDGDNVRLGLNKNLGFTEADRIENIRRIAEVAKLMNDSGLIVLTSFISPFVRDRRNARDVIGDSSFIEIYVSTPLEVCEKRDVRGLYAKARRHEIANFTGITSPYEAPEEPEIAVDTSKMSLEDCADYVIEHIAEIVKIRRQE